MDPAGQLIHQYLQCCSTQGAKDGTRELYETENGTNHVHSSVVDKLVQRQDEDE